MAINFPGKPVHEEVWPKEGDYQNLAETKGVIFQYDKFTNSWDIVGPDNIATTEWVLGQKKDDTTNLERAYDLVTATNDIGVECGYNTKKNIVCDSDFDSALRGGFLNPPDGNGDDIEDVLDYTIPDWAECVSNQIGDGSMSAIGYDRDRVSPDTNDGSLSTLSYKYEELESLTITTVDKDGEDVDWYNEVATDDTLEISFEGSGGNAQYAVYVITAIEEVGAYHVYLRLRYVGSSHPEEEINVTGPTTYYQLRTYKRSVTTAGATFDGPVRVKTDDDEALSARSKTGSTERTFVVNTNNKKVSASVEYNSLLGGLGYDDPELLATYGYVNLRLGPDDVARGPYLPLKGGTLSNEFGLKIKRQVSGDTFLIEGNVTTSDNGRGDLLKVKSSGGKDYLAYNNNVANEGDGLLNKNQIQTLIAGGADTTAYVKLYGDTMKGPLILHASPSYNSNGKQAATKEYADAREYVYNGQTNEPGRIWTTGNSLFFNPY